MPLESVNAQSVLLVHPTGNANVRQAALGLNRSGMLAGFHTTIAWRSGSFIDRLLPGGLRAELARRSYPDLPGELIHVHAWREMVRLIALRRGWHRAIRHETGPFSMDAVCAALDRAVARTLGSGTAPSAVYAYDDCAIHSFAAAHARGIRCFYELPIGYLRRWAALRDEEIAREPVWGQTISATADSEAKLARKDAEIAAADEVIVPSDFVARTLADSPARKVTIVPYGCPSPTLVPKQRADTQEVSTNRPLRVLYVGAMSQRKGISYLLRAMELVDGIAELSLIGRLGHPSSELAAALNRHKWTPTLPHGQVLEAMRGADVLVLPTLFEGRALVVLEALSQGVAVITTPNSGAEDVVLDGETGFIVPIRSAEAIAEKLTRLAEDRTLLAAMREKARKVAEDCTWERYRTQLVAVFAGVISRPVS